jgi:DNA-binding CsgD family transcriptional regulator
VVELRREQRPPEDQRVLSRGGAWIVLHGAPLVARTERRVAVIVEPAHPARIFPLLMSAYGLTACEKEIVGLVLQDRSTSGIADTLVLSIHTVHQHIKNIFEKTGVRSRRDLVAPVFFGNYEPRSGTTSGAPARARNPGRARQLSES